MAYGWKVTYSPRFIEKLVRGLHDFGDEVFDQSQRDVPVDTGTLKGSGNLGKSSTGIVIVYRTTYAARQEFGLEPGATEQVRRHPVKRHTRRRAGGGKRIVVPAHNRGPFIRTFPNGILGRFYLSNAYLKHRPRLVEFISRLVDEGG
jgi:hypothetical protein